MEALLCIIFFAGLIFLVIFPIICFCKLRSINDKLSEIEYRINLLHIKNPEPEKPAAVPVPENVEETVEEKIAPEIVVPIIEEQPAPVIAEPAQ